MAFYGYPNTRVRAMKSQLFNRAFFEKLLEAGDTSVIIAILSKTDYKQDIEKGLVKYSGILGIEEGLKLNIIRDYQKILRYIKGNRQAERLVALLLSRWDAYNIKTIFRGIHSEASKDEIIEQLIPVGQLDVAYLIELTEQTDIKPCMDLLVMWGFELGRELTKVYNHYVDTRKLSMLELTIDKYYFNMIIKSLKKITLGKLNERLVADFAHREIDMVNIMTLLRLVRENIEEKEEIDFAEFFIDGGEEFTIEKLVSLVDEKEIEDVIEKLKAYSYYKMLKEALKRYHFTGALSSLERKIEDTITKQTVSLFKEDPLSIAIIMAFIWAKFNETVNLRIILRGKQVEMPEDQIREALVVV